MKIALVWPKSTFLSHSDIWPPLGLWYISSRLESMGHQTDFFDLNFDKMPNKDDFDCLFVGGTSPQIKDVKRIAEETKNWKCKRILGGAGVWASPDAHKDLDYDLIVGGEADEPNNMIKILDAIENPPENKHLVLQTSKTLDWVLPPNRRWVTKYHSYMWDMRSGDRVRMATMYNTRGCPFECRFCEVSRRGAIWNTKVRYEPIEIIEQQIKELSDLGFGGLAYYDDVADLDKRITLEKMKLHKKYNMKYRCFLRSDVVMKHGGYEYLEELRKGGLIEIFVGIESASNEIKNNIFKKTTIEQDEKILNWCRKLDIIFKGSFILGLPGETRESMEKTRDWILSQRPDGIRIQVGRLIPFKGTPLGDHPEEYDLKYEEMPDDDWFYSGKNGLDTHSFVSTSHLTRDEIDEFWRSLMIELNEKGYRS